MTGLWCITNDVPDLRSCTVRDAHRVTCDGYARRYDRESGQTVITDRPCSGCLPRPAEVGRLCYDHLVKLENAFADLSDLVAFLWADRSNGIRDTNTGGGRGSSTPAWPLQQSRIHASWIVAALSNAAAVLREDPDEPGTFDLARIDAGGSGLASDTTAVAASWHVRALVAALEVDRDALLARPRGAEAAVRLVQVIHAAAVRFPMEEAEHRIVGVRCPNCSQARMVWKPPIMHRGDVVIRCDACEHVERQEWLEAFAAVLQLKPLRRSA